MSREIASPTRHGRARPGHPRFTAYTKDVVARAFASPKGLRPRRRVKPGRDEGDRFAPQLLPVVMGPGLRRDDRGASGVVLQV